MPSDPDEAWIIDLFREAPPPGVRVGVGDDAALFDDGRVVTTDTMVEGVHWDERLSPADVGWKLVAINVSDLGAMAAEPSWALLALSLPSPLDRAWTSAFHQGVSEACASFGLRVIGGDTTRSPGPRVASLTVGGRASRPVLRSGANAGDHLWVTGRLGLAAEGFLSEHPSELALRHLRRPIPPVAFGVALGGVASAMMDLSDGLAADLPRLCAASGLGAHVDPAALPGDGPLAWRTSFGEDYELLFAAPPEAAHTVESLALMHGVAATRIGSLTPTHTVLLGGRPAWPAPLFTHFRREEA